MRSAAAIVIVVFLVLDLPFPGQALSAVSQYVSPSQHTNSTTTPATTRLGYGVIISNLDNLDKVQGLNFNWVKIGVNWKDVEPQKGAYSWTSTDEAVNRTVARGLNILVRVDNSPQWATGTTAFNAPPLSDRDLADFMYALASRYRGRVKGYEIWNEPNVSGEWGGQPPNARKFVQMLRALYPGVKQADPDAKVVTGGLANVGDGDWVTTIGDLKYIQLLYDPNEDGDLSDGAKGFFDAIGSHPYGGPNPPEQDPWNPPPPTGTYFRRAWQHHQMAEVWGKEDREVWVTEFGWLLDPAEEGRNCDAEFGSHFARFKVSGAAQADYTVRAYQYAQNNWPWMGPMILMNLDLSQDPWRSGCEVVQYFSLLRADGSPRPVYTALANMAKVGVLPPTPSLSASSVVFLVEPGSATTASQNLYVSNSGDGQLNWTASKSSLDSWLSVSPASGTAPSILTVTVNPSGLSNGTYTGSLTVSRSGDPSGAIVVPVTIYIGPVKHVRLPLISKRLVP